jgi:hypothetical protein
LGWQLQQQQLVVGRHKHLLLLQRAANMVSQRQKSAIYQKEAVERSEKVRQHSQ